VTTATTLETRDRSTGIAGIAYVVLLFGGIFLLGTPEGDASDAAWSKHFADADNRTMILVAAAATMLSGLAFLVFMTGLARRVGPQQSGVLRSAGTAHGVLVMLAGLLGGSMAIMKDIAGMPLPAEVSLLRLSDALFFATLLLPGLLAAGLVAWSAARSPEAGLPLWLRRAGFAVAGLSLVGLAVFPALVWLIWVLVVSVVVVSERQDN
jgi:hypothetical protein